MLFDSSAHRDVYLIFWNDTEYPCSRFIKDGFKHVFAIERQALGWICLDPNRQDFIATLLPARWQDDVMGTFRKNNPDATILELEVYQSYQWQYPRIGMLSCVSMMQYYLGVWWPHILTPYMLYNKIRKANCHHIKVKS